MRLIVPLARTDDEFAEISQLVRIAGKRRNKLAARATVRWLGWLPPNLERRQLVDDRGCIAISMYATVHSYT